MEITKMGRRISLFIGVLLFVSWNFDGTLIGQDVSTEPGTVSKLLLPDLALDRLQADHSDNAPLLLSQDELDQLIQKDGGGACPIAAGLILEQTLRSMIGLPLDLHPHRTALGLFKEKPELKEGRISNQRFVELLAFLCKGLDETPVAITTVSSPTSGYETVGTRWNPADGPDLSAAAGQIKILAYTVTTADGTVLGRHFVLLQTSDGNQISFVNPGRPIKDYTFIVEYRGDSTGPKRQLFFHSPAGFDRSNQTYELNTIFTIRLIKEHPGIAPKADASIKEMKEKIDQLAKLLREQGDLTNPIAWRRHGSAFGLPGLDLPTEVGGRGWSTVDMLEIFRHAGKHNLNLRDVVGAAHGRPLAKVNSDYARKVVQRIVEGNAYVAVAITEPDVGTEMKAMTSTATKFGDGFKLTGSKRWNARLRQATHVVLYTQSATNESRKLTAFLLPIDHPGLHLVDQYAHGLTGNSFGGLEFKDMYVGSEHLLGSDGEGGKIFDDHFLYWRLMQASAAIGCGEGALDQMAQRIRTRQVFDAPIGRFTHLQQPIGECATKLAMAAAYAAKAAELIDQGDYKTASTLVNGVKAEGVEIALAAADAAMRAHGALGYSREVDLGDRVRDLMGLRIADGTTDVMRMTVVRDLYGYDLWQMAVEPESKSKSIVRDAKESTESPK